MKTCSTCPNWKPQSGLAMTPEQPKRGICILSRAEAGVVEDANTLMFGKSRNGRGQAYAVTTETFACNMHPGALIPQHKASIVASTALFVSSLFTPLLNRLRPLLASFILLATIAAIVSQWSSSPTWNAFAQEGTPVNQTDGPPSRAYTSLLFYDGSGNLTYTCDAESSGRQSTFVVTAATNATPIAVTLDSAHGLRTGSLINIAGAVGNTAANGTFQIVSTGSTTLTLKDLAGNDVAGNGAYTASTATATTFAPRTNQPQWAIRKFSYTGSQLDAKTWIEGTTDVRSGGHICDNRSTYGSQ